MTATRPRAYRLECGLGLRRRRGAVGERLQLTFIANRVFAGGSRDGGRVGERRGVKSEYGG
jgi:hypothetical protein